MVEVENDHKPLETIIRKPLQNASLRIQLMLLRLLRYKLNLKYVPGTKVCIADMLSRAHPSPVTPGEDYPDKDMELRIHSLVSELPISGEKSQPPEASNSHRRSFTVRTSTHL